MSERHLIRKSRMARVVDGPAIGAWWYEEKGGIRVFTQVECSEGKHIAAVFITQSQLRGYFGRLDTI